VPQISDYTFASEIKLSFYIFYKIKYYPALFESICPNFWNPSSPLT